MSCVIIALGEVGLYTMHYPAPHSGLDMINQEYLSLASNTSPSKKKFESQPKLFIIRTHRCLIKYLELFEARIHVHNSDICNK